MPCHLKVRQNYVMDISSICCACNLASKHLLRVLLQTSLSLRVPSVTVTETLVLHLLLEDRGCITESIRILVPVDRMKQKCFQITTKRLNESVDQGHNTGLRRDCSGQQSFAISEPQTVCYLHYKLHSCYRMLSYVIEDAPVLNCRHR